MSEQPKRVRPPTIDEMRAEIESDRQRAGAERRYESYRVQRERRRSGHRCHWPGCTVATDPRLWGCRKHWFMLPLHLRDRIWAAYVPGQEVRKDPSDEYIQAAKAVREWALLYMAQNGGFRTEA